MTSVLIICELLGLHNLHLQQCINLFNLNYGKSHYLFVHGCASASTQCTVVYVILYINRKQAAKKNIQNRNA